MTEYAARPSDARTLLMDMGNDQVEIRHWNFADKEVTAALLTRLSPGEPGEPVLRLLLPSHDGQGQEEET